MEKEVVLMKGNEAIAHAAIRCGCDGYFGYPITPQSEVIETLAELKPWETTGMQVSWYRPDAGGYHLYGWCRGAWCVCERAAWRSWSGNYPALTG